MAGETTPKIGNERKFLVRWIPLEIVTANYTQIQQGYMAINSDGTELRLRRTHAGTSRKFTYSQTDNTFPDLRRQRGPERPVSKKLFEESWFLTEGSQIGKVRYEIPITPPFVAELDLFTGSLAGRHLVEVELPAEVSWDEFSQPAWFGLEVTLDDRFKDQQLAIHGWPEEPIA